MGLLKKIFKPVSKVLDKIIPNEIKPFLPYAAAAFPMLYSGGLGGQTLMQQMMRRGMLSGALNIGGQLAQEGSEGDINLLSAGLGALSGVMTAPGTPGVQGVPQLGIKGTEGIPGAAEYFKSKAGDTAMGQIYSGLGKTSKFMTDPGLMKYSIPATQGTADLMYAEGKRLEDDEDEEVVEETGYTDAAYRAAIRKSMEAYGAEEEEILKAIEAAGYRSGGRVGYALGDLVRRSSTAHAGSGSVNTGGGGSGLGGMVMNMIRNNPQLMANLNQSQSTPILNAPVLGESIKFIDENRNGIDDREEMEEEEFVQVAASGGRVALRRGGDPDDAPDQEDVSIFELQKGEGVPIGPQVQADKQQLLLKAFADYQAGGGTLSFKQFSALWMRENAAQGGLMNAKRGLVDGPGGYAGEIEFGGMPRAIEALEKKETEWITQKPEWETVKRNLNEIFQQAGGLEGEGMNAVGAYVRDNNLNYEWLLEGDEIKVKEKENMAEPVNILDSIDGSNTINMNGLELLLDKKAKGGRINKAEGGTPSVLPKGIEADYRGGGFIPIGSKERADDVPARLSENEFVMTADAVRAAGGGNVNKGAQRMYNVMNNLEARA